MTDDERKVVEGWAYLVEERMKVSVTQWDYQWDNDEFSQVAIVPREVYESMLAATTWRQIESAPKDGTEIILAKAGTIESEQGVWNGAAWRTMYGWFAEPTHWMPLPPAPRVER
jgi:hypothetical protein